ncbi:uncharacterized protein [Battus philenor]|uniref:uncharacterized protein n=1 Tax=Battus philenor TaxID=42288 RepID=UPI0035CFB975
MALYKSTQFIFGTKMCRQNVLKLLFYSTCDKGDKGDDSSGRRCRSPTLYDCRKYGHDLPGNNVKPDFDTLCNIPSGIFRCTGGEILGPGGPDSSTCYQNPEYFSFHHMTYYDLHMALRQYRKTSPVTGRKK